MAFEAGADSLRYGQIQGTGAEEALMLKVYGGEVLTAFERETVTAGRVNTRTISSGKSAQFPLVGAVSSSYHVPGENLITEGGTTSTYMSKASWDEKIISIDGLLQTSTMIHDIDDWMAHYEARAPLAREMGWALAKQFDLNVLQVILNGSEKSATITGDASDWGVTTDKTILDSDFDSGTAANSLLTMATIATNMDTSDVPRHGRHIAVEPALFNRLLNEEKVVSADYNQQTGASGTGGKPTSLRYLGMEIHPTNRIADIRAIGTAGEWANHSEQHGTDYSSNIFDHVLAFAWQEDWAVGVVRLQELGMQAEHKIEYQGTFMLAGFSVGFGVLHESACFVVQDDS